MGAVGVEVAFFVPFGVPGVACWIVSFVLRMWLPLQPAGAYVDGLAEVFLGLSAEAAWGHLITWMTSVPLITISHFSHQYMGCPREGLRGCEGGAW